MTDTHIPLSHYAITNVGIYLNNGFDKWEIIANIAHIDSSLFMARSVNNPDEIKPVSHQHCIGSYSTVEEAEAVVIEWEMIQSKWSPALDKVKEEFKAVREGKLADVEQFNIKHKRNDCA